MRCEILCTGAELLDGRQADANTAWLAGRLTEIGFEAVRAGILPDDEAPTVAEIRAALSRSPLLILSGGLGPTRDDLTREALARATGRPLARSARAEAMVRSFFRGREMPASNLRQAFLPRGAEPLANPAGTAPGIWLSPRRGRWIAALPGVPGELRAMFSRELAPRLRRLGRRPAARRAFAVFGLAEAAIDERIGRLPPWARYAITAREGGCRVVLSAAPGRSAALRALSSAAARSLRAAGGIVRPGLPTLQEAVVRRLLARRETLALAESCTGGRIAAALTEVPGASGALLEGIVAYGNAAKVRRLGVKPATLRRHGAVSEETAREMAAGARRGARADWGLSVTGIAGPSGGTATKPVGLACFGLSGPRGDHAETRRLTGARDAVQARAAAHALGLLLREMERLPRRGTRPASRAARG